MTGFVYAIENADGFVKIGWSAKPYHRLAKINSDTSSPCWMVGTIKATREQEKTLHRLLHRSRVHREWYQKDASIEVVLRYFARRRDGATPPRKRGRPAKPLEEANPHPTTREILSQIEKYCAARGMPISQFGLMAMRDGSFVTRLRAGNGMTMKTVAKVKAFMESHPVGEPAQ